MIQQPFSSVLGWIAGTGATITVAQAINKLHEQIKVYDDNIKQGEVVIVFVNDRSNDMYFIDSGNVGIGYSRNKILSAKLHINGNLKCSDISCDDIFCDKIGIGTNANHTNTLLDVRGHCSFGNGFSSVQAISLRSHSGFWNIQSDNLGTNNINQLVINSIATINNVPNVLMFSFASCCWFCLFDLFFPVLLWSRLLSEKERGYQH